VLYLQRYHFLAGAADCAALCSRTEDARAPRFTAASVEFPEAREDAAPSGTLVTRIGRRKTK
jgi:hypothetical protein